MDEIRIEEFVDTLLDLKEVDEVLHRLLFKYVETKPNGLSHIMEELNSVCKHGIDLQAFRTARCEQALTSYMLYSSMDGSISPKTEFASLLYAVKYLFPNGVRERQSEYANELYDKLLSMLNDKTEKYYNPVTDTHWAEAFDHTDWLTKFKEANNAKS